MESPYSPNTVALRHSLEAIVFDEYYLLSVHVPFWYVISICVLRIPHSLPFLFLDVPLILDVVYALPPWWAVLTHLFLTQGSCVPRGSFMCTLVLDLSVHHSFSSYRTDRLMLRLHPSGDQLSESLTFIEIRHVLGKIQLAFGTVPLSRCSSPRHLP